MLRFGSLQPTSKLNGKLCLRLKRCVCLYYIHTLHVYDFIACEYAFSVLGSGKEIIIFDLCHAMFIKLLFSCVHSRQHRISRCPTTTTTTTTTRCSFSSFAPRLVSVFFCLLFQFILFSGVCGGSVQWTSSRIVSICIQISISANIGIENALRLLRTYVQLILLHFFFSLYRLFMSAAAGSIQLTKLAKPKKARSKHMRK